MTGKLVEFCFDPGVLTRDDVERISANMWSDIAFDQVALAHLKRDGLHLDGVRLTGPSPYQLDALGDGQLRIRVEDGSCAETYIDLWRVHFMRGLRPGSVMA